MDYSFNGSWLLGLLPLTRINPPSTIMEQLGRFRSILSAAQAQILSLSLVLAIYIGSLDSSLQLSFSSSWWNWLRTWGKGTKSWTNSAIYHISDGCARIKSWNTSEYWVVWYCTKPIYHNKYIFNAVDTLAEGTKIKSPHYINGKYSLGSPVYGPSQLVTIICIYSHEQ